MGYLRIDVTDNCNLRCIHCQAYNGTSLASATFMDFCTFKKNTVNTLSRWGVIQLGNVAEPTIHPCFSDFLKFIREQTDATIHIVTNGKLLSRYAAIINEVGNCLIQISMDSPNKATYEYIRVGSSYDNLMRGIDRIDLARNRVLIACTLMNSNIEQYGDMVAFCKGRGFIMSAFPMILRDEHGVVPLGLIRESLWFNRDGLIRWTNKHYGKDYDGVVIGTATGNFLNGANKSSCSLHKTDAIISTNGSVSLCGVKTIGNVMHESLTGILSSKVAVDFRAYIDDTGKPCAECNYRKRCCEPSMTALANHFSENIVSIIPVGIRSELAFDRLLSDEEALNLFVRTISSELGVYDITKTEDGFQAQRIERDSLAVALVAATRFDLQKAMVAGTQAASDVVLVEEGYHGYNIISYKHIYYAAPQAIGHINITNSGDRERCEILNSSTITDLKLLIDEENNAILRRISIRPRQSPWMLVGDFFRKIPSFLRIVR